MPLLTSSSANNIKGAVGCTKGCNFRILWDIKQRDDHGLGVSMSAQYPERLLQVHALKPVDNAGELRGLHDKAFFSSASPDYGWGKTGSMIVLS